MIEGSEDGATAAAAQTAAAIGMAMNEAARNPSTAEEARMFLREQAELSRKQKTILEEEAKFSLSHLHFRRFGDFTKAIFEIAGGLLALLVVAGLGAMIWSASRSGGLVIEAFSVPPGLAERGLTGEVVASKLLDRIASMQAETQSQRAPETYANYWGNDFKVEIPETAISLSELERYLREKLGHPTHLAGEVVRTQSGITITARTIGGASASVSGAEGQFEPLLQQLAERVYRLTQPYRYGVWVFEHQRLQEAKDTFAALASSGPGSERAWGYLGLSNVLFVTEGYDARLENLRTAIAMAPDMFLPRQNLALSEEELGQPEQFVRDAEIAIRLVEAPGHGGSRSEVVNNVSEWMRALIAANRGDFPDSLGAFARSRSGFAIDSAQQLEGFVRALAGAHDLADARDTMKDPRPWQSGISFGQATAMRRVFTAMLIDAQAEDWLAVVKDAGVFAPTLARNPGLKRLMETRGYPWLGEAYARLRRFDEADTAIMGTPSDCYVCLIARGTIRSLEHKPAAAEWWMARAAASQPAIPFAYFQWGKARMQRGDLDGAIEEFHEANAKGPHFADPLEMWGEALMRKNRSDLALSKFEEANRYAPNWGRLHLRWGEALYYVGRKDEGRAQFAAATRLDLSDSDKRELAISAHRE